MKVSSNSVSTARQRTGYRITYLEKNIKLISKHIKKYHFFVGELCSNTRDNSGSSRIYIRHGCGTGFGQKKLESRALYLERRDFEHSIEELF